MEGAGVVRSAHSLEQAAKALADMGRPVDPEVANLVAVGQALVAAATAREETRGSHARSDFPGADDALRVRLVVA